MKPSAAHGGERGVNRNRIRQRLIHFAEEDKWDRAADLIWKETTKKEAPLSSPSSSSADAVEHSTDSHWLTSLVTDAGDGMIHLSAFAACDASVPLQQRRFAFWSLRRVLSTTSGNDLLNLVNRMAQDGGTALISALSSASMVLPEEELEDGEYPEDEDTSDEDDDDDDDDIDDDDDDDGILEEEHQDEEKEEPLAERLENNLHLQDLMNDPIMSYTSSQLIRGVVDALLESGADAQTPLRNTLHVSFDDEELELAYSKESVIEEWTPLAMTLQWITMVAVQQKGNIDSANDPMAVLQKLIDAGADPTRAYGATVKWNALEFWVSCAHLVAGAHDTLYEQVMTILLKGSPAGCSPLSDVQKFAAAMLSNCPNDVPHTRVNEFQSELLRDVLPLPDSIWGSSASSNRYEWTMRDAAVAVNAVDCVKLMVQFNKSLDAAEAMQAFFALFSPPASPICMMRDDPREETLAHQQKVDKTASILIGAADAKVRQNVVDKLLLYVSTGDLGGASALHVLLKYGADAQASSVLQEVQDGLSPLHFVAANCRDHDGIDMVQCLLKAGADVFTENNEGETPLFFALRARNHGVAGELWKAERARASTDKHAGDDLDADKYSKDEASVLAEAAMACRSLPMLQHAVDLIRRVDFVHSHDEDAMKSAKDASSRVLGQLLLHCLDPRSGLDQSCNTEKLLDLNTCVQTLLDGTDVQRKKQKAEKVIASFSVEPISGHSPLHLLLRTDRGSELRKSLLAPLCQLAVANEQNDPSRKGLVSLPCKGTHGAYTALHMACALGCEESVKTLLKYGANVDAKDGSGRPAMSFLPRGSMFLDVTLDALQGDRRDD